MSDYTCTSCGILACCNEDKSKMPLNCPMKNGKFFEINNEEYLKEENSDFYINSAKTEAIGYCKWTRLKETLEFCKMNGFKRIGLAFCKGLQSEAKIIDSLFKEHGFEVISVMCKTGGIPKEQVGITEQFKIKPQSFESMCNPIAQAKLLNDEKTEINILVGLCVGHDSLFYKYSDALVTTLIVKDRVLAHNPVGAVYLNRTYFRASLKPE